VFLTSWRQLTLALVVAWFAAGVASMAVVWSALSLAEPTSVAPVAGLLANQFSPWCAAMGGTPLVTWMLWERPSASGRTGDWVRYPGLAAAWVMLHLWLTQALPSWFQGSPQLFPAWQLSGPRAMTTSVTALVQFALTVGFTWAANNRNHAITQARLADELSQRESALRADLTTAQLALLRQQLHPHFLFNALNTASVDAPAERVQDWPFSAPRPAGAQLS
jgi:hypothetical protein